MSEARHRPVVFYSPPLRDTARDRWLFETLLVDGEGRGRRMPGDEAFYGADARKRCAAHVVEQIRVDREAVRRRGGAVGLVAVLNLGSWEDLCLTYDVADQPVLHP